MSHSILKVHLMIKESFSFNLRIIILTANKIKVISLTIKDIINKNNLWTTTINKTIKIKINKICNINNKNKWIMVFNNNNNNNNNNQWWCLNKWMEIWILLISKIWWWIILKWCNKCYQCMVVDKGNNLNNKTNFNNNNKEIKE